MLFPRPSLWWSAVGQLWTNGELGLAIGATVRTFVAALIISSAAGTGLGILLGRSRAVDRSIGPVLEFCRVTPAAAVVPVVVLFFGFTDAMKVSVVVFAAIWPILLNVRSATNHLSTIRLDVAATLQLGRAGTVRKVLVPSVVPAILLGVRVAAPIVLIVALLVETITRVEGVGALIASSQERFQSAAVYGLVLISGLMGLVVNLFVAILEGWALRYEPNNQGQ